MAIRNTQQHTPGWHTTTDVPARWAVWGQFLALFLPLAAAFVGMVAGVLHVEKGKAMAALEAQAAGHVYVAAQLLSDDLAVVASDLLVLAQAPTLKRFLWDPLESTCRHASLSIL